jgi:hypothetical protein
VLAIGASATPEPSGQVRDEDGRADWENLRAETDEARLEYLSEADLENLRRELDGKQVNVKPRTGLSPTSF